MPLQVPQPEIKKKIAEILSQCDGNPTTHKIVCQKILKSVSEILNTENDAESRIISRCYVFDANTNGILLNSVAHIANDDNFIQIKMSNSVYSCQLLLYVIS